MSDALALELQKDPEGTLKKLEAKWKVNQNDLDANQQLAEAHFELGNADKALGFLSRSVELDPTGEKGGFSKFLWLGQLVGGADGIGLYRKGIDGLMEHARNLDKDTSDERRLTLSRISAALLGMIEIWMTDLCLEPEAESQCEKLISEAFLIDDAQPEHWSVLGSIRISQQRYPEAKQALQKAWELYAQLEDLDPMAIGALVRLTQSLLEMQLAEAALEVLAELHRLDDQIPDVYYLTALAHQQLLRDTEISERDALQARSHLDKDFELEKSKHIVAARDAIDLMAQIPNEDIDPDMAAAAQEIANSLPDPSVSDPFAEEDAAELRATHGTGRDD